MKKVICAVAAVCMAVTFYACNDPDYNTTTLPLNGSTLVATINNQGLSSSATAGGSSATGSFAGNVDRTSNVMSYTVTFTGLTPTAITLEPVSASTPSSSPLYRILLAGSPTSVGSGTSTTPGSGTSTTPGTGTVTTPGTGTSTTPGTGTSTTPGTGTATTPGTGTSTTPGSGTGVALTSPLSGTVSVSAARADSLLRGLYRVNIRSSAYPNGEIGGIIQVRP